MNDLLAPRLAGCRRIFLHGYAIDVSIGFHDFEREAPQRVIIDVDLFVPDAHCTPQQDEVAEVVDALATDTYAEPTGVPSATAALSAKISYLYMALRNGLTVTSSKKTFLDDSGAGEWSKPLSDDGTTYTEGEGTTP